jgi:hypothetical protein
MPYGVVHNNFWYFYYPVKADGTKSKQQYLKRIWVPLGHENTFLKFDTEEAAISAASEQYYNEKSWKVIEIDEEGNPVPSPEVEKLKLGYRPTRADEGERVD